MIKTAAYVLSIAGLILLGVVGWATAEGAPEVRAALAGGVLFSAMGLVLRLHWHRRELKGAEPPRTAAAPVAYARREDEVRSLRR